MKNIISSQFKLTIAMLSIVLLLPSVSLGQDSAFSHSGQREAMKTCMEASGFSMPETREGKKKLRDSSTREQDRAYRASMRQCQQKLGIEGRSNRVRKGKGSRVSN